MAKKEISRSMRFTKEVSDYVETYNKNDSFNDAFEKLVLHVKHDEPNRKKRIKELDKQIEQRIKELDKLKNEVWKMQGLVRGLDEFKVQLERISKQVENVTQ